MAIVKTNDQNYINIANAIRSKLGTTDTFTPGEMDDAISSIPTGGGITPSGTKQISITQNGTTTEDVTQYANAEIIVNVPIPTYAAAENHAFGGV